MLLSCASAVEGFPVQVNWSKKCYGEIGEIDRDHHDYHESTIPQKVIFWKLVVKILILVVSRGQKTQVRTEKNLKISEITIWQGCDTTWVIRIDTDEKNRFQHWFFTKTHVFYMKTSKKLRKNLKNSWKTQEKLKKLIEDKKDPLLSIICPITCPR